MNWETEEPNTWRFWESFAWAINLICIQCGQEAAKDFLSEMYEYCCWGIEPNIKPSNVIAFHVWKIIEPNLSKTVEEHKRSAAGGRAKADKQRKQKASEGEESKTAESEKRRKRTVDGGEEAKAINDEKKRLRKHAKAMSALYEEHGAPKNDNDFPPD